MSNLTIERSQAQGTTPVTILHLTGELDGSTEEQFLEHTRQTHADGTTHLLIDLSGVRMLTSAGLRAIHNTLKIFTPPHEKQALHEPGDEPYKSLYFKLVCPNPQVYYVLNISGFVQNILIYNDMNEALLSFS